VNEQRRLKQPLDYPSAGSTFKRPKGFFAAKLIEDSGLKGCRVGGAMVSEKHAGFIINYDNATSRDVSNLIDIVRETVFRKFGVELPQSKINRSNYSERKHELSGIFGLKNNCERS
jgi:UDP-N-acetylmuramate dehydrogenase